jgi:hypothetical protein
VAVYDIGEQRIPLDLRVFAIRYKVNRVLIENRGRSAAKNCKGIFKIADKEEKVCWSVPTERYKMTINAHSMEYLDLCAILDGDQAAIFNEFCASISKLRSFVENMSTDVYHREALLVKINEYSGKHKPAVDIPMIIAPTENGWQSPPQCNHAILKQSETKQPIKSYGSTNGELVKGNFVIVTAENAKRLKQAVEIMKRMFDDTGRILRFPNELRVTDKK